MECEMKTLLLALTLTLLATVLAAADSAFKRHELALARGHGFKCSSSKPFERLPSKSKCDAPPDTYSHPTARPSTDVGSQRQDTLEEIIRRDSGQCQS